jgi:predicted amidohydrolase
LERKGRCASKTAFMSRTLVAAAIQTAAHDRTALSRAWPPIAKRIREAASSGAQLVVVPEGTLPAYVLGYDAFEEREIAAALDECRAIAREHRAVVVVGAARREGERTFNSALVIDADGSIAGAADKHFLWHFDRQWFAAGERLQPIQTSIGALGVLVCADGRIPTIARTLVDRGAELLVMPTAWVTSGRDPDNLENIQADLLARVRARENDVPFVAANKCGVELGCVAYCGKSQIIRADGTIAALATQDGAETIVAQIEMRNPKPNRNMRPIAPASGSRHAQRIAITAREPRSGDNRLLRILEADVLLYGNVEPFYDDAAVLDPGSLASARLLGGTDFAVWRTSYDSEWQVRFARARALELRMYIVVIDENRKRAYAVDPDGVVACGTFDGYEIASFTYDPARTAQTLVAPGTDVRAGLERAAMHADP